MVWDEETIGSLREFWSQGLSTAEIGRRLGMSKNAIVGKAHRLDLDGRPSPIRRNVAKPAEECATSYLGTTGATLPPLASADPPATQAAGSVAVSNVRPLRPVALIFTPPAPAAETAPQPPVRLQSPSPAPRPAPARPVSQPRRAAPSCCWPIGDPGTKTFRFCDDLSLPGKPYCDEHAKLAYVKIRDRKEDAA